MRLRRPGVTAEATQPRHTFDLMPKERVLSFRPASCSSPESAAAEGQERGLWHLGSQAPGGGRRATRVDVPAACEARAGARLTLTSEELGCHVACHPSVRHKVKSYTLEETILHGRCVRTCAEARTYGFRQNRPSTIACTPATALLVHRRVVSTRERGLEQRRRDRRKGGGSYLIRRGVHCNAAKLTRELELEREHEQHRASAQELVS